MPQFHTILSDIYLSYSFHLLPLNSHLLSTSSLLRAPIASPVFSFVASVTAENRMLDMWQTLSSFLTPATLFLLLNLVIATIVLSSRRHHRHDPDSSSPASFSGAYHFPLLRTTSPVLDRLRSFTLHRFRSGDLTSEPVSPSRTPIPDANPIPTESEPNPTLGPDAAFDEVTVTPSPPPLARTSSILERLKSINLYRFRSGEIQTEQVKIETTVTSTDTSSDENHFGRSQSESSRPVVKKKKMKKTTSVGGSGGIGEEAELRQRRSFRGRDVVVEEEVDARADDFINRFKEQLKIQRLNSILNYKEMLNRGK